MPPKVKPKRVRKPLHWITADLIKLAQEAKLDWQDLSDLIFATTELRIAPSTLKFWSYGYSHPRIDEIELIAKAFGYELELMKS